MAEFLTPKEAAEILRVKVHTVLAWIRSEELRAWDASKTPGRGKPRWRIPREAVEEFVSRRQFSRPAKVTRKRARANSESNFIKYY